MKLLLGAQDIALFTAALIDESGVVIHQVTKEASPESQLRVLSGLLTEWSVHLDQVKELYIISGPGSFTACRSVVTMANTIAFVQEIPMRACENPERDSVSVLLPRFEEAPAQEAIQPSYDRPPRITKSKKRA